MPPAELRYLLRKVQPSAGFGFGAGASPQVDREESHGRVPEDFLGTVPLARNRPRPLQSFLSG